jgi:fructokinase
VLEPTASTLATLVEQEAGRRLIAYDPNIRPSIQPDLDVWRRALARLTGAAHLVKVSAEDLATLFPGSTHDAVARRWLSAAARLVVVTEGGGGATAWTRETRLHCPAEPVTMIDTVGAGDSFQAALLAGLAEMDCLSPDALGGLPETRLSALLQFACSAAALTCSRRGADLPRRNDIARPLS